MINIFLSTVYRASQLLSNIPIVTPNIPIKPKKTGLTGKKLTRFKGCRVRLTRVEFHATLKVFLPYADSVPG